MGIKLKVGSVLSIDVPGAMRIMPLDPTIATVAVAEECVTITAVKAGQTWVHLVGGNEFSGMLMLTVTEEKSATPRKP